ncbi:hypothetical protein JTE90_022700 [Oedothorax gibbosus]|uniref:VWFC domain-containing protein n=1 Tax=Oedothorax gibbosus TaxID=931172 RepID=A0AAV6UKI2_9ARAC|nr:hypothetical protein JTE90_022700 [Oedothorax gibbosus]
MKFLVFAVLFCVIGGEVWARAQKPAQCEARFFQHYVAKECQPVFGPNDPKCPVRFRCPESVPVETSGCKYQGKIYPIGQDIPTGSLCQMCSCRPGWDGAPPQIVCVGVECPSVFGLPIEEDCYETFEKDKCCSTGKVCGASAHQSRPTCEHEGKTYYSGQHIEKTGDPCLVCTCHDGWTGEPQTDPNCRRVSCILEKDLGSLNSGCLPIYHEATCCPIEYDCGQNLRNTTTPFATKEAIASGDTCVFKGSHYRIGQQLDIGHPTNCVKCDCVTPPEFTCIHQSCHWPDDDTCSPTFVDGQCCPQFECSK